MSATIDTFIYLKRDIEQSFQHLQKVVNSSNYNQQIVNQLLNHILCTLDDLQKVNQSISISSKENTLSDGDDENDYQEDKTKLQKNLTVSYSKENEEREEFIQQMKKEYEYYKTKVRNQNQMEIIRLDQAAEDENEDHIIRKQEEQLEDMHHSIVSLKNLTKNINFEINDHIRVLDNLETDMVNNQNQVENLTRRTKNFIRTSDGIGGHTCLFGIAVVLFFLIIILILFF